MDQARKIQRLKSTIKKLYALRKNELPFHGWHHINFVFKKSSEFSTELEADLSLVQAAALTHDLNYIVHPNSSPDIGKDLRQEVLRASKFTEEQITKVENIVNEAHIARRDKGISVEAKALSDADTLYKALPITPILFSSSYVSENQIGIKKLAEKILTEQKPLRKKNILFYSKSAKRYLNWADTNLMLWENAAQALEDDDVLEVLDALGIKY